MRKRSVAFFLLLTIMSVAAALAVFGCITAFQRNRAIARDGVLFDPPEIPQEVIEISSSKQLLLLGESHYEQEHEDFVHGPRDSLPPFIEDFDGPWLRQLRAINDTIPEEEAVSCLYFDMNHGIDAALISLRRNLLQR